MQRRLGGVRTAAAATAMAIAGLTVVATAAHANTGPHWVATRTGAVPLQAATPLGAASASTSVPVEVSLALRDQSGLDQLLAAQQDPTSPEYHHYLTPAEFAARYGATTAQADQVADYLRTKGFSDVQVSSTRLDVSAVATAQSAAQAFNTKFERVRAEGRTGIVNTAAAQVPSTLGGLVNAVIGLDQVDHAVSNVVRSKPDASRAAATDYSPKDLATIYGANGLAAATGTSLAIMANGNLSQVVTDLRTAESGYSLPQVPVSVLNTTGAPNGGTDTSGVDEYDIDTQSSSAMASNLAHLYIYDPANLDDTGVTAEISTWASSDTAQVASASYGICDSDATGITTAVNNALAEAASQGQSFFASTGDGPTDSQGNPTNGPGDECTNDAGTSSVQTQFPSSSPYTTAVGGTTLTTNGDTYVSETGWTSGGGGKSTTESRASWADDADNADLLDTLATNSDRATPDISMDADPNTGADIVVGGKLAVYGGTSLASPLAAGGWARIQSVHSNDLGAAVSTLYGLYNSANGTGLAAATPGLYDITSGSNGNYSAHTGYDLVTGLGSMNIYSVSQLLSTAPSFTADTPPSGTVNIPYAYRFTASGSPAPAYSESGQIPWGLTFNGATGLLSGTPTKTGTYTFTVVAGNGVSPNPSTQVAITIADSSGDAVFQGSTGAIHLTQPIVAMAVDPVTGGYWLVASDGGVFAYNAPFYGSAGNLKLTKPIVGMAATPNGQGYYLVASDGGIFSYGNAPFHGSAGNLKLTKPIVGMAIDSATGGYWLDASDGGIFAYGAPFHGSAGALPLAKPVVGMAPTADGGGYYLVATDGGIFTYGDAAFHGSAGNLALTKPVVGLAVDTKTGGYWLDASDGGIFTYDATFYGSAGNLKLTKPVVGMAATPSSQGYYLVASDGGIFNY